MWFIKFSQLKNHQGKEFQIFFGKSLVQRFLEFKLEPLFALQYQRPKIFSADVTESANKFELKKEL